MRWLVSAHKATRRFLNCHQHRLHGVSNSGGDSLAWKSFRWPKSVKSPSLFHGHQYSTTAIVNCSENRRNIDYDDKKKVVLDITSIETIKPTSPTPHHLRTFNLSIIDQLFVDCYTQLMLFFPNNNKASTTAIVKHLKKSLSGILTSFYPLAGEIKDDLHIMCNDKGVIFVEARVNQSLNEFLLHTDDEKVRELVPKSPRTGESSIGNYIIGVQVNIFNCGGIGLSTSVTHKLFDGHTYFLFIKAWAAATRGSPEIVLPSFVASEVFPHNPYLNYFPPSMFTNTESVITKRFVFDSSAVATLKDPAVVAATSKRDPTRMEATTAIIWKAAAKASSTIRHFGPQSPHALFSYVNIRPRASPPLPYESIGNLVRTALAICYPKSEPNLPNLFSDIRESIEKINSDHIDSLKGEKGHEAYNEILKQLNELINVTAEGDNCLFVTSLLNRGIYDVDFGWGLPIWFYDMNAGFRRIVALNDTLKGGGVEATITLSSDEMELFESDPELLSYATVNTSPLQFLYY